MYCAEEYSQPFHTFKAHSANVFYDTTVPHDQQICRDNTLDFCRGWHRQRLVDDRDLCLWIFCLDSDHPYVIAHYCRVSSNSTSNSRSVTWVLIPHNPGDGFGAGFGGCGLLASCSVGANNNSSSFSISLYFASSLLEHLGISIWSAPSCLTCSMWSSRPSFENWSSTTYSEKRSVTYRIHCYRRVTLPSFLMTLL